MFNYTTYLPICILYTMITYLPNWYIGKGSSKLQATKLPTNSAYTPSNNMATASLNIGFS